MQDSPSVSFPEKSERIRSAHEDARSLINTLSFIIICPPKSPKKIHKRAFSSTAESPPSLKIGKFSPSILKSGNSKKSQKERRQRSWKFSLRQDLPRRRADRCLIL